MGRILEEVPVHYPELEIDLVEDTVEGLQRRLADGPCDLAIMYDIGVGADVKTVPLYACPPYAVLPAGHRRTGFRRAVRTDRRAAGDDRYAAQYGVLHLSAGHSTSARSAARRNASCRARRVARRSGPRARRRSP
ncbi:LysR substrate-binding domain-containing protein [Nocardia sp. NPDC049526]|uniref:LysR substrate-binding domain-containing protein n=1 Tax=Nocardia sp. NPDC049526 TaxID=3364316 RepID=UPI00379D11AB